MKFDSIHGGNHHSICTMHSAKQDFSTSEIILMQCLFSILKFHGKMLICYIGMSEKFENQFFK